MVGGHHRWHHCPIDRGIWSELGGQLQSRAIGLQQRQVLQEAIIFHLHAWLISKRMLHIPCYLS